jgi:WD40 repeat protein
VTIGGRLRPRALGRRRSQAEAPAAGRSVPPRTELSDALADPAVGNHQLFALLTGVRDQRQLWWRCCQDAVRSHPGWLDHADHDTALALIGGAEPRSSRGAISRAAESVDAISRILASSGAAAGGGAAAGDSAAAGAGQRESTVAPLLARATACWADSLAIPRPTEGAPFQPETAVARAVPGLRDQVRELLAGLDSVDADRGQAMTAITALRLAQRGPNARRAVRVPVVLAQQRHTADGQPDPATGVAGTLALWELPAGPAGLFPDPAAMRVLRADGAFRAGLELAWEFASGPGSAGRCVLWRLTLDGNAPDYAIDGGSLGAAFAVALHELMLRSTPRYWPRAFLIRIRPSCAITGVITAQRPAAYDRAASRTVHGPWLDAVGGMAPKFHVAQDKRWRLVAPAANRALSDSHTLVPVHWAQTVRQADRYARRPRPLRTALTIGAALLIASPLIVLQLARTPATPVSAALNAARRQRAAALRQARVQGAAALSDKLANLAVTNLGTHLDIAQLLAVEATRIDNTPQAQSAVFQAATASPDLQRTVAAGAQVTALAAAADGQVAVAGTGNGHVIRFNPSTGARTQVQAGSHAIKNVAVDATGTVIAASNGSQVFVWREGHVPVALPIRGAPSAVAVSPSGGLAAAVSLTAKQDTLVTLWNVQAGGQVSAVDNDLLGYPPELGFPSDSELLVAGTLGESQRYAVPGLRLVSHGHPGGPPANGFAFGMSANGVFSGYVKYGSISAWHTANVFVSVQNARAGTAPAALATYLTFSDDGTRAASIENGTITVSPMTVVNSATGASSPAQSRGVSLTGSSGTTQVSFLGGSDDRLVSAAGSTLGLWDLHGSVQIGPPTGISVPGFQVTEAPAPLTVSPDGRYLAMLDGNPASVSSINRPGIRVWVYRNGPRLTQVETSKAAGAPIWSGDELVLIGAADDGHSVQAVNAAGRVLGSWPVRDGPLTSFILNGQDTSGGQILIPLGGGIESFNPRTRSGTYRPVRVPRSPHLADEYLGAISPDGKSAIIFGSRTVGSNVTDVVYVNLVTGAAHVVETGQTIGAQFTSDRLVVLLNSGQVQEWDATGNHLLNTLPGNGGDAITVSPNGTTLAQVSNDGVAAISNLATGQVIASLDLPPSNGEANNPWGITTVAFSPGQRYLFTATPGGTLTRWDIGEPDLIHLACRRAGHDLTPAIWAQYVRTTPPANLSCG